MFANTERSELAALWDELVAGTSKVESWSHAEDSWSMVVSRRPDVTRPPAGLRRRDVAIVENALLSGVRKHVAVEMGLSCSSIAVIMQSCFQFMGLACLPSRIPGLLVAAAHARHHPACAPSPATSVRAHAQPTPSSRRTITVSRPDALLAAWLAPAEHAVIHLLIEGLSYVEIAEARQTSVRTVANQVASGFRRLDVSGRAELLCLLARWGLEPPPPPTKRPSSLAASSSKHKQQQQKQGISTRLRAPDERARRRARLSPNFAP